jgi:hypothetical protein
MFSSRRIVVSLAASVLSLTLPAVGSAGPIIQDFSNEARNIYPWVGQTFTAEDPLIDLVGVYVVDFGFTGDTTIDYSLYEGVGIGGTLLGTRTFSGLTDGFAGYANVSFAGIPLVVGSVYTILVSNDTFEWGVASAFTQNGSAYPGGTARLYPDYSPGIRVRAAARRSRNGPYVDGDSAR